MSKFVLDTKLILDSMMNHKDRLNLLNYQLNVYERLLREERLKDTKNVDAEYIADILNTISYIKLLMSKIPENEYKEIFTPQ